MLKKIFSYSSDSPSATSSEYNSDDDLPLTAVKKKPLFEDNQQELAEIRNLLEQISSV